jgi:ribosome-binding protein aMBF1 (putative translation factor)
MITGMTPRPKDELDDIVAQRTSQNPEFPQLLNAAAARRELMDALRQARIDAGLSQTEIAARMHTSASSIARLERVAQNSTLQTVQEYAGALGKSLTWSLADMRPAASRRPVRAAR